jgi:Cu/Ag efflux protein CusF
MAAMTMDYKVDDPSALNKGKPGDQIMATIYDGDLVLHKVQVMPKQTANPSPGSEP